MRNPYKEPYRVADLAIAAMTKKGIRRLNECKRKCISMKFDELNVLGYIEELYKGLDEDSQEAFRAVWLARFREVYWWYRKRKPDEDELDELLDMEMAGLLRAPNPVVKYAYEPEVLRKRDRCGEAVAAVPDSSAKQDELDKHLKYFEKMASWFVDFSADDANLKAIEEAGGQYVVWNTQNDSKVCEDCKALNGLVFPIHRVPDKPHPGCRCYLTMVRN